MIPWPGVLFLLPTFLLPLRGCQYLFQMIWWKQKNPTHVSVHAVLVVHFTFLGVKAIIWRAAVLFTCCPQAVWWRHRIILPTNNKEMHRCKLNASKDPQSLIIHMKEKGKKKKHRRKLTQPLVCHLALSWHWPQVNAQIDSLVKESARCEGPRKHCSANF